LPCGRRGFDPDSAGQPDRLQSVNCRRNQKTGKYTELETGTQPWVDESKFDGFNFAIQMKSLVIYCVDPCAPDIPQAVAKYFNDEIYPGAMPLDEAGNQFGSTRTMFTVTNGGGRAAPRVVPFTSLRGKKHYQKEIA
jgi:carbonic anhydrase